MPYKTKTNHELNAYRARLDAKIAELEQAEERWHHIGDGWVLTEKKNILVNPNGAWKWNGWEIRGQRYAVRVFADNCTMVANGVRYADGCAEKTWVFDGGEEAKAAANEAWKQAKELARDLRVSRAEANRRTKRDALQRCYNLAERYARELTEGRRNRDLEDAMGKAATSFDGYEWGKNEIEIAYYDDHISVEDESFYWAE